MNNTETKAGINFSFPERARAPECQFMNRMGVEFFSQTFVKTPFFELSKFVSRTLIPPIKTVISGAVRPIN